MVSEILNCENDRVAKSDEPANCPVKGSVCRIRMIGSVG
jgi:hypothetical protein